AARAAVARRAGRRARRDASIPTLRTEAGCRAVAVRVACARRDVVAAARGRAARTRAVRAAIAERAAAGVVVGDAQSVDARRAVVRAVVGVVGRLAARLTVAAAVDRGPILTDGRAAERLALADALAGAAASAAVARVACAAGLANVTTRRGALVGHAAVRG